MVFQRADNNYYYHSKQIFLSFHWPRAHHVTCKKLPTNNGLLMLNAVQLCLTANNILDMRKGNRAFHGRSLRFLRIFIKKTNLVIKLMIKQLLNLVIAKYHDLSVSCRSIICLSLRLRQIII